MTTATPTMLVPQMIAAQAAANPHRTAVITGSQAITYRDLLRRVDQVAETGFACIGFHDRVIGLSCRRSVDGLVAMLAISGSGGAWLYLDPTHPDLRRQQMVDQACAAAVITTEANPPRAVMHGRPAFAVEELARGASAVDRSDGPWPPRVRSDGLCYIVYTSGSTGTPKGVAVEHRGVANMARQLGIVFDVTPGVRVLQFANWSWDAAAGEILTTLAAGATLVLAPEPLRAGGGDLAAFLRQHRIQVATLTPSVLAALPDTDLPDLRTVVAVGEPCPPELVHRWTRDGRQLLNGYGLTETTVAVSVGRCQPGHPVTIGAPLPGVTVRVVDDTGAPVPFGAPGQLLVGGVGVARGYLGPPRPGQPEATIVVDGDQFFSDDAGQRWYRTGDIVTQHPDQTLRHLGRGDHQLQIHGHRVEPTEIVAALRHHPLVHECAVTVHGGHLVAYVRSDADPQPTPAALAATAAEHLPPHMLPTIHLVRSWPRTDAGTPDLAALDLAALDHTTHSNGPARGATTDPATTTTDTVLDDVLALVRAVLERDQVGPDDDLFVIGGHSLLAAQLTVTLDRHFGTSLDVRQIIEHPTARRLADLVRPAALASHGR